MRPLLIQLLLVAFFASACTKSAEVSKPSPPSPGYDSGGGDNKICDKRALTRLTSATQPTYSLVDSPMKTLLQIHCIKCHGKGSEDGDYTGDEFVRNAGGSIYFRTLTMLPGEYGHMPKNGKMTEDEKNVIKNWERSGYPAIYQPVNNRVTVDPVVTTGGGDPVQGGNGLGNTGKKGSTWGNKNGPDC